MEPPTVLSNCEEQVLVKLQFQLSSKFSKFYGTSNST